MYPEVFGVFLPPADLQEEEKGIPREKFEGSEELSWSGARFLRIPLTFFRGVG